MTTPLPPEEAFRSAPVARQRADLALALRAAAHHGLAEGVCNHFSAELAAARQSGLTKAWSAGYIEPVRQSALRASVRAETLQAIASGELQAINATVYGYTPAARVQLTQAGQ